MRAEVGVSPVARRSDTVKFGRSGGVYPYETQDGVRWRFVSRRSDGMQTSKRGVASERAARDARRRPVEQAERGEVRHTRETFGAYWERWLTQRRPYLEAGTWTGYEISGRKRLVPAFGHLFSEPTDGSVGGVTGLVGVGRARRG